MAKRKLRSNNKSKEQPPPISPDGLPVVTRGRGRPPKNPAEPPTKQWVRPETESEKSSDLSESSSSSDESEEEYAPQSANRKRGKAGKNYVEVDSDIEMDDEEGKEGDSSRKMARNLESVSVATKNKIREVYLAAKYWNCERREDFLLVTEITGRQLSRELEKARAAEKKAMMVKGEIETAEDYREKYETVDLYKSLRDHQDLPWQVEIKEKLDSGEKVDWSEEEAKKIAEENGLELLQVEAFIVHQKNGAPPTTVRLPNRGRISEKVRKTVRKIFETRKLWSRPERDEFCEQHPEASTEWLGGYLKNLRAKDKTIGRFLENEDEEMEFDNGNVELEGIEDQADAKNEDVPAPASVQNNPGFKRTRSVKRLPDSISQAVTKLQKVFKTRKFWNNDRRDDFLLVTGNQIHKTQLTDRLCRLRKSERDEMIAMGMIEDEKEYNDKYGGWVDLYVTLRNYQNLPWQVEIKEKLDSGEKVEWSEEEANKIAEENGLELLQVEAYIVHQRNGAPQPTNMNRIWEKLREAVKKIYETRKEWSRQEKEEFCKQHPEVDVLWLKSYLNHLRKRDKMIERRLENQVGKKRDEDIVHDVVEVEVQNQSSSVNVIPEEEVIRWNVNAYKCSEILKKRRLLPDNIRYSDPQKQEALEEAYSRCKTVNAEALRSIRASTQITETEVTEWFQRRRAYDFEDVAPTETCHQKIFQAWLYFGHQLDEEEELLTLIAKWAGVPIHEARKEVTWLTKKLPQVVFGSESVPLRDFLEHIDVFSFTDWREHLKRSPEVQYLLEKTFISLYFHNKVVLDEQMMAETGTRIEEVSRWLDERMKWGLERKKDVAGLDKNTRIQLIKFWSLFNELGGENILQMVAKWAGCLKQDVVKFYKEREQVVVEGNAARVVGVREQENQGEQIRHENHDQNYVGPPESVKQLLREDHELLRRAGL